MFYIADTHAWVYYLFDKLPEKANEIFTSAEKGKSIIIVPSISLAECIHLIETRKIALSYEELFSKFEKSTNFIIAPLDFDILKIVPDIRLSELHDRVIVVTAKIIQAKVITEDDEIIKSGIVKTIWK